MKTTIRILIDEDFTDPFAEKILAMSGIDGAYVRDISTLRGKEDPVIWDHAQKDERILLARDSGFCRKNYPVCTHEGIIRFKTEKYDAARIEAFRRFLLSGHRSKAKHAITYLYGDACAFETCDGTVEYRYD